MRRSQAPSVRRALVDSSGAAPAKLTAPLKLTTPSRLSSPMPPAKAVAPVSAAVSVDASPTAAEPSAQPSTGTPAVSRTRSLGLRALGSRRPVGLSTGAPSLSRTALPTPRAVPVDPKAQAAAAAASAREQAKSQAASMAARALGFEAAAPLSASGQFNKRYFSVVFRRMTNSKHKKWDGDGFIEVSDAGVHLLDSQGASLGRANQYPLSQLASLREGESLVLSRREIEIMAPVEASLFESGKCFLGVTSEAAAPARPTARAAPKLPSFRQVAAEGSPNDDALVASQPRHSPDAPGALVLPRPPEAHVAQHSRGVPVNDVVVDPHIGGQLRPHQREGVVFLYECVMGFRNFTGNGAILADEMGLGKTIQTIALIWTLLKQGPYSRQPVIRRALVICPATLVRNWEREFRKWLGDQRVRTYVLGAGSQTTSLEEFNRTTVYSVLIVGYEKFRQVAKDIVDSKVDLVVLDEGHRLKNSNVDISKAIRLIPTTRRIILSGTPVQNNLAEFHALVDVVNPTILGDYALFKRVFEDPVVASRQPGSSPEQLRLAQLRADELSRMTGLFILRRKYDVNRKFLPAKSEILIFCPVTDTQRAVYEFVIGSSALSSILVASAASSALHLTCLTLLRKICNSLSTLDPGRFLRMLTEQAVTAGAPESLVAQLDTRAASVPAELDVDVDGDVDGNPSEEEAALGASLADLARRRAAEVLDAAAGATPADGQEAIDRVRAFLWGWSSKLRVVSSILASSPGEKVVIVSSFTEALDVLETLCIVEGAEALRLDGRTPTAKRQEIVDRFNAGYSDVRVLLLSARAGGAGLNLTGASRLVLYDINWNPAIDQQAMGRIWREGQLRPTFIYRLFSVGTVEERIFLRQIAKEALSDAVVDGKKVKTTFSRAELRKLFSFDGDTLSLTHDLLKCECLDEVLAHPSRAKRIKCVRPRAAQGTEEIGESALNTLRDQWSHLHEGNAHFLAAATATDEGTDPQTLISAEAVPAGLGAAFAGDAPATETLRSLVDSSAGQLIADRSCGLVLHRYFQPLDQGGAAVSGE
ncbi:hypothetical protein H696_00650 [Fonticula alba]|uniref:DNA repair and recombination protein RAD54B n=1 Tax=Fonticula alba TaxID=691883 RepID=A0A058ZFE3_FONAL|nr:hypothetical protein H696_00650 [Fonticula alba]KCV73105.1 hypothetical protein H696_00650 [Fonticula alba]|eukprot:XP_009492806.1 hypothetical protein H696_00650 [Fonticula alba]